MSHASASSALRLDLHAPTLGHRQLWASSDVDATPWPSSAPLASRSLAPDLLDDLLPLDQHGRALNLDGDEVQGCCDAAACSGGADEFETEFILFADQEPIPPRPPFRGEGFEDVPPPIPRMRGVLAVQPWPLSPRPPPPPPPTMGAFVPAARQELIFPALPTPISPYETFAGTCPHATVHAPAIPYAERAEVCPLLPRERMSMEPPPTPRFHSVPLPPAPFLPTTYGRSPAPRPRSLVLQRRHEYLSSGRPSPFAPSPIVSSSPDQRSTALAATPATHHLSVTPSLDGIVAAQGLTWSGCAADDWPFPALPPPTRWPTPALGDHDIRPLESGACEDIPPGKRERVKEDAGERSAPKQVVSTSGSRASSGGALAAFFATTSSPSSDVVAGGGDNDGKAGNRSASSISDADEGNDDVASPTLVNAARLPHLPLVVDDLSHHRTRSALNSVGNLIPTGRATSAVRRESSEDAAGPSNQPATPTPTAGPSIDWSSLLTPARKPVVGGKRARTPSLASDDEILTSSSPEASAEDDSDLAPAVSSSRKSTRQAALPKRTTRAKIKASAATSRPRPTLASEAVEVFTAWWEANKASPYPSAHQKAEWVDTLPVTRTQVDDFFINRRRRAKAKPNTGSSKPARGTRSRPRYPDSL